MEEIKIVESLKNLSEEAKVRIRHEIMSILSLHPSMESYLEEIRERKHYRGYTCPNCHSTSIVRFGTYLSKVDGKALKKQRYRCKDCCKTFTDLTNSPLYRTRRLSAWVKFIECMIDGYSLRKSASMIPNVHYVTLFYWRHKVLRALQQVALPSLEGIVEMDETYFLYSEKGKRKIKGRKPRKRGGAATKRGISNEQVCVLVARARTKETFIKTLGTGRLTKNQIETSIGHKLSLETTLCTDAWSAFETYAKERSMPIYQFKSTSSERVQGIFHIQNVNSFHSRLKRWMVRFNGVATKYLDHYLTWFTMLEKLNHQNNHGTIKEFLVNGSAFSCGETNATLRLSKFKVT